ncbi:MAG TPA: hypothetical protein VFP72_15925 [Kineosporiaceae bacterium]|nr:hypothetical protein [Kineosporiaceae bacterium]
MSISSHAACRTRGRRRPPVSGVLPGRTVDITAARRFKIADKVLQFLGLLADLGYVGLQHWIRDPFTLTGPVI